MPKNPTVGMFVGDDEIERRRRAASDTNEQRDPVKEARELLARATQGPLQAERYTGRGGRISRAGTTRHNVVADIYSSDDFTLYARAPELLKTLCDEVDRLRGELNEIYDCDKCDLCEDH